MDIVSLLILRALSGGGGETPVASQINYDNSTSGLDAENVQNALDELSSEKLNTSEKGTANGVAELNENGLILTSQLPSYVDDVLEYNTYNDFPQEGESGKIYVDLSTNRTYRWGGSSYTEISPSLALGETSSTAYRGDRGKTAYDHSQLKTGNPHNVTKAQVGLGNVDNTSDANKPISIATQAALDTKLSEDDLYNMIEDSTVSGNPVTLKTLAKTNAKSAKVTMLPIQSGSGDPSPTNIRPISGRDSVNLGVTGKNLFDEIYTDISGTVRYKQIKVGNGTFTFSTDCPKNSDNAADLFALSGYATSGGSTATNGLWEGQTRTVTTNDGYVTIAYRQTVGNNPANYHTQIEIGSTATEYEPYQGTTYTATFPSTIYGGEYEFVEGGLKNAYIKKKIGDFTWSGSGSLYNTTASDANSVRANIIAEDMPIIPTFAEINTYPLGIYKADSQRIYIKDSSIESVSELLAKHGDYYICYGLATPTETTLTPQSISLNKGDNVITTDGDSAEIVYTELDLTELPDVTSADEGKVLTVNSSGEWVADNNVPNANLNISNNYDITKSYLKGDYCIYNNDLYKCIVDMVVPSAWDNTKWKRVLITDELTNLNPEDMSLEQILEVVDSGLASSIFKIGDQITTTWTDTQTNTDYEVAFDICQFGNSELEGGEIVPSMTIQMHYCMPFGIQFDAKESFYVVDSNGMSVGDYTFNVPTAYSKITTGDYQFTVTEPLSEGAQLVFDADYPNANNGLIGGTISVYASPTSNTKLYTYTISSGNSGTSLGQLKASGSTNLNSIQCAFYGYSRWSQSALRQYMNSSSNKDAWWTANGKYDRFPTELTTKDGFIKGFSQDFLNCIQPTKIATAKNTITDDGTIEYTYDKFFIPSLEEMNCTPQASGEGEVWEKWKRQSGSTTKLNTGVAYPQMRTFAIENPSSAMPVRVRSCGRGYAHHTWHCYPSGTFNGYGYASSSLRFGSACKICKSHNQ